jgi:hypothetical protein
MFPAPALPGTTLNVPLSWAPVQNDARGAARPTRAPTSVAANRSTSPVVTLTSRG